MTERRALSKRVRFEVFKRDSFTCRYCGRMPPTVVLQVDHVVPVVEGGGDEPSNLATSCFDCNSGKSGIPLNQLPAPIAALREMMAEQEEQERAYIRFVKARRKRQDKLVDTIGEALFGEGWGFKPAGANSCRQFLAKLPFDRVLFAAEYAHAKTNARSPFKYFCATCWGMIRENETPRK